MKQTVGLFLIICMVFLLSACADNMNSQEAETESSVSQTAAEAAENEMSDSENSEEPDNTADDVKAKLLYISHSTVPCWKAGSRSAEEATRRRSSMTKRSAASPQHTAFPPHRSLSAGICKQATSVFPDPLTSSISSKTMISGILN